MKTFLTKTTSILAGMLFVCIASATTITVTVGNYSFTPSNFNATVGDTVEWVWNNGTHTTTSTSVPMGAATWNHPMNVSNTTFKYVITTAGTYNYWCAIHTSMMEASFTVNPAGVKNVSNPSSLVAHIYPNPANDVVNLTYNLTASSDVEIKIYNEAGQLVNNYNGNSIQPGLHVQQIAVSELPQGIYFCRIEGSNAECDLKFVVVK